MRIEDHPTVQEYRRQLSATKPEEAAEIKADWLKKIAVPSHRASCCLIQPPSITAYRRSPQNR